MHTDPRTIKRLAERGVNYCRQGEWDTGMSCLARVAEVDNGHLDLPAQYHSYLGFGIAYRERRISEGIQLCRKACEDSFFEPENFLNLARTYMIAGNKRLAYRALSKGYALDSRNNALSKIHGQLGFRRPPVLRFLSRNNPLNRILGQMRHSFGSRSASGVA